MKTGMMILALTLSFSISSSAWISHEAVGKVYSFKFKLKGESFDYKQKSSSYEEAYEMAAKACYKHYKAGQKLTEDRGLDIIDVCANPRTT